MKRISRSLVYSRTGLAFDTVPQRGTRFRCAKGQIKMRTASKGGDGVIF